MTKLTVNLNKLASELCGEMPKVRIRAIGGVLQIRPTDRKIAKGLPAGEVLVELRKKTQAVSALRFTMPEEIRSKVLASAGNCFLAEPTKHGWITLKGADKPVLIPGKPSPAGGSVSSK